MASPTGPPKQTTVQGKPQPSLLFERDYAELLKTRKPFHEIESQLMTNVVLLATLARSGRASQRFSRLYRGSVPPSIKTSEVLAPYSFEQAQGKSAHYRVSVESRRGRGKYLVFGTLNVIRAGKHTHAHAVHRTSEFLKCLRKTGVLHPLVHPSVWSCPNTVVTGRVRRRIDPKALLADWRVNSTKRFPGKSINIEGSRVVPEVYPSDGRFIMPGVANAGELLKASTVVDDVAAKCCVPHGISCARQNPQKANHNTESC